MAFSYSYRGGVIAPLKYATQWASKMMGIDNTHVSPTFQNVLGAVPVTYNRTQLLKDITTVGSPSTAVQCTFNSGAFINNNFDPWLALGLPDFDVDSKVINSTDEIFALITIGQVSELMKEVKALTDPYLVIGKNRNVRNAACILCAYANEAGEYKENYINNPNILNKYYIKSVQYYLNSEAISGYKPAFVLSSNNAYTPKVYAVSGKNYINTPSLEVLFLDHVSSKLSYNLSTYENLITLMETPVPDVVTGTIPYILQEYKINSPYQLLMFTNSTPTAKSSLWKGYYERNKPEYFLHSVNNSGVIRAFSSPEDIISFFADWGITASTKIDDIEKPTITPPDLEPLDPDPTPTLPSYPDNSTDKIDVLPPNITTADFTNGSVYNTENTKRLLAWFKTNTFLDDVKRLYLNPIDVVLSLRLYNIDFYEHDSAHMNPRESTTVITVSTDIPNYSFRLGYNTIINGGSYKYLPYFGNYNDYVNTTYQLYVPYVGIISLQASDVVNHTISLKYALDIPTGNSTYIIMSDDNIIKTGSCHVGSEIPITSSNLNSVQLNGILSILSGAMSGDIMKMVDPFIHSEISMRPQGSVGNIDMMEFIPPYMIITKFPPQTPSKLVDLAGKPATYSTQLTKYVTQSSGCWVQCDDVELKTSATSTEREMLLQLIKSGIWL